MDLVKVLPAPEKADQISELLSFGWSERDIIDKVFGSTAPEHTAAVRGVRSDPHGYDTDVDEIAVARALEGDRAVWDGLTHYERREVMLRVAARRDRELQENAEERAMVRGLFSQKMPCKQPHDRAPDWFLLLAEQLGLTQRRLHAFAREYATARVL